MTKSRTRRFRRGIDGRIPFVVCSKHGPAAIGTAISGSVVGRMQMTKFSSTVLAALALTALATPASAQKAAPTPWALSPDTGYAYDKAGKTYSYKMGTSNAKELLKGAKKVPKG